MGDEDGVRLKPYLNIPGLIGTLIASRMATLHELQTVYCLEDAYDMYEAYIIPKYNEWRQMQVLKAKSRTKK